MTRVTRADAWFGLAAAVFVGGLVWFLLTLADEDRFGNATDDYPLLLTAIALPPALVGWWALRRQHAREAARGREEREGLEAAAREERERLEGAVREEHAERERLEDERTRTRAWAQELQARLAEHHKECGSLGDPRDVRELVLRTALALTEAEKGLLLSREDLDSDGDLDLVASVGFEHDPTHSAVAQHFAREVIERDVTIRSDDPSEFANGDRTPADAEIDNLVAIPIWIRDRFNGVVVCAHRPGGFHDLDDDVLLALGDHAGAVLASARLRGELRGAFLTTVRVLADALEAKDRELRLHSNDVARYVADVAARIGVDPRRREQLVFASLLHDIGKLGISERILLKPGKLTPEERVVVELHPKIGHRLIEQIGPLSDVATAILHHHERWDGDGYPAKLRGEEIPLDARLIGIVDAFMAMLSDRPYQEAMTLDQACDELERCAGSQFDPSLVRLFLEEIRRRPPALDSHGTLADALAVASDDPEIAIRRANDRRLLGDGAFSIVDNLTLLYGHRYLHEAAHAEAERAVVQGRPFAVFVACVDGLADVNRSRGYHAGDDALRAAADAVQRVASTCGGVAARESGRRIALLVPGAGDDVAEELARSLELELVAQEASVTWATWREGDTGEDVIARAKERGGSPTSPLLLRSGPTPARAPAGQSPASASDADADAIPS